VDVPPVLVRGNQVVMVTVQVDPNNTIAESNENNNEVTGPMRDPSTLPDLVIQKVDIQQTKVTPVEVKVTVRVKNQGKVDAPAYDVAVWEQETPGQPLQFGGLPGLKAGQSYDLDFNTQPAHADPAKYIAEVDPQNKILEADENNNRGSGEKKLQIDAKLPDLVATIDKVELVDNKTRVALTWTVRNQGGSDAPIKILVAIHQQQGLTQGGPELTNGLKKGQSYGETVYFSLPQNPADAYGTQVTVTVDSTNAVAESNEGNNVAVAYIPDPRPKVNTGLLPTKPPAAAQQ
jgi:subtilase family serine protease